MKIKKKKKKNNDDNSDFDLNNIMKMCQNVTKQIRIGQKNKNKAKC